MSNTPNTNEPAMTDLVAQLVGALEKIANDCDVGEHTDIAKSALSAAKDGGWVAVPVEFVRGFNTLAHNYSLTAEPPFYYQGTEGAAFSNAYRRCGEDLAKLKAMLAARPLPNPPKEPA